MLATVVGGGSGYTYGRSYEVYKFCLDFFPI